MTSSPARGNKRPRLDDDDSQHKLAQRVARERVFVYVPMRKVEGIWEPLDIAYLQEAAAIDRVKVAKDKDKANGDADSDSDSDSSGYSEAEMFGHDDDYDEGNIDHPPRYKIWQLELSAHA
jgi:hypothetical protein